MRRPRPLSDLGAQILVDLRANGPSTAAQIAGRLGHNARGIATALTWLRGEGWVLDGTTSQRVGRGIRHTAPDKPITWSYLERHEQSPLNRVFHGQHVRPLA